MIIFTGDLHIGNDNIIINDQIQEHFNNADYIISNLESCLFSSHNFLMRKDKSSILSFTQNGFKNYISQIPSKLIFTLGNNHMHDFGEQGIKITTNFLEQYKNIAFLGIGNTEEVIKPLVIEDNGKKIAMLPISTDEPEVMSILAKDNQLGVLNMNDCKVNEIIRNYKKHVDYFIILPHWGREYINLPSVQQRKKAYEWIDSGADLIIGHHPHVIQGKENYNGKCIYYSLGNYIFPDFFYKNGVKHSWSNMNSESILLNVTFEEDIKITEKGLFFNISNNTLDKSNAALNNFIYKTSYLSLRNYTLKEYYGIWQKELFSLLKMEFSFKKKFYSYFPVNKDYGRLVFFLKRVYNKIKKKIESK